MEKNPELYERGARLLSQLHGGHAGEALVQDVADVCPDFAIMTVEWALAGVMARPHLDLLTRQYIVIAACVTLGHATPQLAAHLQAARGLGASKAELVEVILQTLFYAGEAATANALRVAKGVFATTP
jgi:4-carboxymuconolactone decarboxylase